MMSASLEGAFLAGITIYVSSAYLCIEFPVVTVVRSEALITHSHGTARVL